MLWFYMNYILIFSLAQLIRSAAGCSYIFIGKKRVLVSVLAKEVLLQSYFLSTLTTFHYFAVYEAGKAVKKGVPSHYAPTLYAPSMYAQPAYGGPLMNQPGLPLLPLPNGAGALPPPNGYSREYDGASSGEWISVLVFFLFWLEGTAAESFL